MDASTPGRKLVESGHAMGDIYAEVGRQIRARRRQQSLTLEDLSELSGLHASYIGQIERGIKKSSLRTIALLAASLGVTTAKLFLLGTSRDARTSPHALVAAVRLNTAAERRLLLDALKRLAKGLRELRA